MARRREQASAPDAFPARFRYEDWAGDAADGPMSPMKHRIRALRRYLLAKHHLRELPTGEVTHF